MSTFSKVGLLLCCLCVSSLVAMQNQGDSPGDGARSTVSSVDEEQELDCLENDLWAINKINDKKKSLTALRSNDYHRYINELSHLCISNLQDILEQYEPLFPPSLNSMERTTGDDDDVVESCESSPKEHPLSVEQYESSLKQYVLSDIIENHLDDERCLSHIPFIIFLCQLSDEDFSRDMNAIKEKISADVYTDLNDLVVTLRKKRKL